MGPGSGKRKRPDRQDSQDGERPSPHRPEQLPHAHYNQRFDNRGRGDGRRGRGGHGGPRAHNPNDRRHQVAQESAPSTPAPSSPSVAARTLPSATPQTLAPARFNAPRATPASREPSPPLEDFSSADFEYLTDDSISTWDQGGSEKCKELVLAVQDTFADALWIQELVQSAINKRLDASAAGAFFAEINAAKKATDAEWPGADILADAVSLLAPSDWKRTAFSRLVYASGIPPETWRMVLETDCIEALGMSRDRFARKKAVKITNHLYRQSNYNLLREESEGYAKLVTDYFNIAQNASATDSSPTIALDAFERVKALIGSFDLDVGRVLDISLDVFANLLVRNFRFFVKFIRASSWWPSLDCPDVVKWEGQGFSALPEWAWPSSGDWGIGSEEADRAVRLAPLIQARDVRFWQKVKDQGISAFSEIGARHITNFDAEAVSELLNTEIQPSKDDVDGKGVEKNRIKRLRTNDRRKWMLSTKTLPPPGNPEAANLLGFKLSFYSSPARDPTDIMPDNLIYLSALLIKIGFISLRDLYPHLYPKDEAMADVKLKLEKELEDRELASRPGGGLNKLAMSGALTDDTLPPVPAFKSLKDTAASSKASSPKPEGTPKTEAQEDLPEPPNQKILLLKSLLAIGAIPDALFILGKFPWLAELVPDLPDYIHRILHHMLSKVAEPPLSSRSDLSSPSQQPASATGSPKTWLHLAAPSVKPAKRWAQLDKPDDGDGVAYKFYWDNWSQDIPVCQSVDDVFLMCSTFLNFSGVKIGKDPALLVKLARIGKRSLAEDRSPENESRWIDLLKRLLVPALSMTSKNPSIANEVYDLLRLFPVSTRYSIYAEWHYGPTARLPDIKRAFDRTRLEAKDVMKRISKTNVRPMGKALAKVAYGSPGIVLQTAINQMESYENLIEVFVECSRYFTFLGYDILTWCLLNALGGGVRNRIQDDGMLTSSWLRALATFAGAIYKRYSMCEPTPILHYIASELRNGQSTDLELLEQLIVAMIGIKSNMAYNDSQIMAMAGGELLQAQTLKHMADERHKNDKSAKRLIKALTDSGLAGQILVAIAQERQVYSTRDSSKNAPLKVLGNNMDKIHQILIQYLESLRNGLTTEEFAQLIPEPLTLMTDFGLDAEVAFMVGRAGVAKEVAAIDARRKAEMLEKSRSQTSQPAEDKDVSMADGQQPEATPAGDEAPSADVDMKDTAGTAEEKQSEEVEAKPQAPTTDVWHPALASMIDRLPSVLGENIASTLSVPFYATFWTLGLQDILVNNTAYDQELAHQSSLAVQIRNDRSDSTAAGQRERERKIKETVDLKDALGKEMRGQIGAYTQIRNRLSKEKDHWFGAFHSRIQTLHVSLLQNCFLPRVLFSPLDAQFTFTMIKFLHNNGTPGFRTMHLFDFFFKKSQLGALIFSVTAREAENLGRFTSECMKELMTWHNDQAVYEKNAYGNKRQLPGFAKKLDEDYKPSEFLSFEEFRHLLYKWQSFLTNALKTCLESSEYMHIRNAIIVLKAMPPNYPVVNFMVNELVKKVQDLSQSDPRGDLKLAALSLLGNLKPQEKNMWLPNEFKFANGKRGTPAATAPASTNGAKPAPAAALNAKAAEFKPTAATNGAQEAEDGEIDDDKKDISAAPPADAMDVDKKPAQAPAKTNVQAIKQDALKSATPSRAQTPNPRAAQATGTPRDTPRNTPGPRGDRDSQPSRADSIRGPRSQQTNGNDSQRFGRSDDRSNGPSRAQHPDDRNRRDDRRDAGPIPRSSNTAPAARPSVGPANGPAGQESTSVNPGRLALIQDAQKPAPVQQVQRDNGPRSGGNSPRGPAGDSRGAYTDARSGPGGPAPYNDRRSDNAPSGPRQDRGFADGPSRRPVSGVFDSRQAPRAPQDASYGRLNAPSQAPARRDETLASAPAGPRQPASSGARVPSREQQGGFQGRTASGPAPSAPPAAAEGDGVHPSRRGHVDAPSDGGRAQPSAPNAGPGPRSSNAAAEPSRNGRPFADVKPNPQSNSSQPPFKGRGPRTNGSDGGPPNNMPPPQASGRPNELARSTSVRSVRGPEPPQSNLPRSSSRANGFDYPEQGPRADYSRGAGYDVARHADYRGTRDDYAYPPQDTRGQFRDDYARGPPQRPTSQYGDYPADPYRAQMGPGRNDYPRSAGGYDARAGYGAGRGDDRKRRAEDMGEQGSKRRRDGQ